MPKRNHEEDDIDQANKRHRADSESDDDMEINNPPPVCLHGLFANQPNLFVQQFAGLLNNYLDNNINDLILNHFDDYDDNPMINPFGQPEVANPDINNLDAALAVVNIQPEAIVAEVYNNPQTAFQALLNSMLVSNHILGPLIPMMQVPATAARINQMIETHADNNPALRHVLEAYGWIPPGQPQEALGNSGGRGFSL